LQTLPILNKQDLESLNKISSLTPSDKHISIMF